MGECINYTWVPNFASYRYTSSDFIRKFDPNFCVCKPTHYLIRYDSDLLLNI